MNPAEAQARQIIGNFITLDGTETFADLQAKHAELKAKVHTQTQLDGLTDYQYMWHRLNFFSPLEDMRDYLSQLEEDSITRPAFVGVSMAEKRIEVLFHRAVVTKLFETSIKLQQELRGVDITGLQLDLGKLDIMREHERLRKYLDELSIEETRQEYKTTPLRLIRAEAIVRAEQIAHTSIQLLVVFWR